VVSPIRPQSNKCFHLFSGRHVTVASGWVKREASHGHTWIPRHLFSTVTRFLWGDWPPLSLGGDFRDLLPFLVAPSLLNRSLIVKSQGLGLGLSFPEDAKILIQKVPSLLSPALYC
jgi:hypothetical protein